MIRRFDLGMSLNYCADWGVVEAIREFAQNAKDAQTFNESNKMYFDYNKEAEVLRIGNKNGCLTTETLLLGKTTKANDENMIGQHGEGYKVATVVLMRLGKQVKVYNRSVKEVWTAKVVDSKRYNAKVVVFDIEKVSIFKSVPDHDLIFEISNISEDEYSSIVESNLSLQDLKEGADYIESNGSKILLNEKFAGKLFVGGLFVTSSRYAKKGYDFKPSLIKLDRDRSFIDGLDLQFLTGKVICEGGNMDLVRQLKNVWDGQYICWYLSNGFESSSIAELYNEAYNDFIEEWGSDAIPCNDTDTFNRLKRNGYNAVILKDNDYHYVSNSSHYVKPKILSRTNSDVADDLEAWFDEWISEDSDAYEHGCSLIEEVLERLRK
jgi:hypothetical protein